MNDVSATLGQRLKAERERKGLGAAKAADALHLDSWMIDALESGNYARMGPAVYVKGHLKRYAVLLGLPPAEMLEAYEAESQPAPPSVTPPAAMRMRTSAPAGTELPWPQIAGFTVVALVVIGLLWWRPWHPHAAAAPAAALAAVTRVAPAEPDAQFDGLVGVAEDGAGDAAAPSPSNPNYGAGAGSKPVPRPNSGASAGLGSNAGSSRSPSSASLSASRAAPAVPAASAGVASPKIPTPTGRSSSAPVAGVGRARLRLSFSADSWVDVHDATGQRVFAGNGRANSVKIIAGAAPLRVYLKSASGVQLEINNHAAAIGPQFVAGDVARFEAGADGVLRRDARAASANGATTADPRPRG